MIVWIDPLRLAFRKKTIFLDRDGVINQDRKDYVKSPEEFVLRPEAVQALPLFVRLGFQLIVVSNQSGIGRGIITWDNFWKIHNRMIRHLRFYGCSPAAAFYCPHKPEDDCPCRKPKPEMIREAISTFDIPISECFFIGDSLSDMEAAARAGCRGIKIAREEAESAASSWLVVYDMLDAVKAITRLCLRGD